MTKHLAENAAKAMQMATELRLTNASFAAATGKSQKWASGYLSALVKQGRLARLHGDGPVLFVLGPRLRNPTQIPKTGPGNPASVTIRAPQRRPPVEVITPEGVKVTVGPALRHDPRYQVEPGVQPYGAGFAAVGIGRDIRSGRAWA